MPWNSMPCPCSARTTTRRRARPAPWSIPDGATVAGMRLIYQQTLPEADIPAPVIRLKDVQVSQQDCSFEDIAGWTAIDMKTKVQDRDTINGIPSNLPNRIYEITPESIVDLHYELWGSRSPAMQLRDFRRQYSDFLLRGHSHSHAAHKRKKDSAGCKANYDRIYRRKRHICRPYSQELLHDGYRWFSSANPPADSSSPGESPEQVRRPLWKYVWNTSPKIRQQVRPAGISPPRWKTACTVCWAPTAPEKPRSSMPLWASSPPGGHLHQRHEYPLPGQRFPVEYRLSSPNIPNSTGIFP